MKIFVLIIIVGVVVTSLFFIPSLRAKLPSTLSFPTVLLPKIESPSLSLPLSDVTAASAPSAFTQKISQTGSVLGQVAGSVLTTSTTGDSTIDVSVVTRQIADHIEQIPSQVLKQAKIEYCKQVLLDASVSAKPLF